MTSGCPAALPVVIARLRRAWNERDLEALLACFHPDYQGCYPLHPERDTVGLDGPRWAWGALLEAMPDFQAELLGWAVSGATVWTEWRWTGTAEAGGAFTAGGVLVFTLCEEAIAAARIYTETVSVAGPDWDAILAEIMAPARD